MQGGKTPLYIAARGSFTAIVDMIIKTARLEYTPKVKQIELIQNIYIYIRFLSERLKLKCL